MIRKTNNLIEKNGQRGHFNEETQMVNKRIFQKFNFTINFKNAEEKYNFAYQIGKDFLRWRYHSTLGTSLVEAESVFLEDSLALSIKSLKIVHTL